MEGDGIQVLVHRTGEEHAAPGPSSIEAFNHVGSTSSPPSYSGYLAPDKVPPPTYEEAIDPNAPPPSYDSLFMRVRQVHKSSTGILDFFKNLTELLIAAMFSVVMMILFIIPVSMIAVGLLHFDECPNSEYLPMFLVVGGGFGLLKQLLYLSAGVRVLEQEREEERMRQSPTQTIISCFMLGWLIIGSMWVYGGAQPSFDPSNPHYCNKILYTFTVSLVTSVYICLATVIMCLCSASAAGLVYEAQRLPVM